MHVALIAAVAENGVIGRAGALPWRLPEDLRHFRKTTTGHHVVMGRKTWESLGRPLAGRTNLVLSRDPGLVVPGAIVLSSLEAAISLARDAGETELFVIGGGELYRAALPHADRVYLTRVALTPDGDVHFPELDSQSWIEVARTDHRGDPDFSIAVLKRLC